LMRTNFKVRGPTSTKKQLALNHGNNIQTLMLRKNSRINASNHLLLWFIIFLLFPLFVIHVFCQWNMQTSQRKNEQLQQRQIFLNQGNNIHTHKLM
jgi:hypothetical protein